MQYSTLAEIINSIKIKGKRKKNKSKKTKIKTKISSRIENVAIPILKDEFIKVEKIEESVILLAKADNDSEAKERHISVAEGMYSGLGQSYSQYTNYEKIFSYLGLFRSKSSYEDFETPTAFLNHVMQQDEKFFLVDNEVARTGIIAMKYLIPGDMAAGMNPLPPNSMSSSDWESFKLWAKIDPVMYNLRMRIGV